MPAVVRTSYRRAGRLVPRGATGLRARAIVLNQGTVMDWHSTRTREELLIALSGVVEVEVQRFRGAPAPERLPLKAGQCVFLPRETMHRVVNRSGTQARYIYVTAPARRLPARGREPSLPLHDSGCTAR